LTASLSKTNYLQGEPVVLVIGISNQQAEPVAVWRPYFRTTLHIVLTNDSGRVFPYGNANLQTGDGPGMPDPVTLDVGDSLVVVVDLVWQYLQDIRMMYMSHKWWTDLQPGRYFITVKYEFDRGRLQTKPITFVVEEPPPEEKEAYDLLVKASDSEGTQVAYLDRIIAQYPQSSYHTSALQRTIELYEFAEKTEEQGKGYAAAMSLIHAYPASEAASTALNHILARARNVVTTDEQRCAILQEMLANYPGSLLAGRAKELMKYSIP
jgi:hypothetical protein